MFFYTFKVSPPGELFIEGIPKRISYEVIKLCFIYKDGTFTANLQKKKNLILPFTL